jgi:nucleotide-binding universal stress UspA family protein
MQLKNVLCPLDFSPASLRAFDYAIRLAQKYGARLHLLHVIAPVLPIGYENYFDTTDMIANIRKQAESELKELRKVAVDAGVKAGTMVQTGHVQEEITHYVNTQSIDIVVIGKHGRRAINRWFLGSTTERLLRHLPVPILIIGEGKPKRAVPPNIERVLMTTDFSGGTPDAVSYALSLAGDANAIVTVLHVIPITTPGVRIPFEEPINDVRAELERLLPAKSAISDRILTKIKSGVPHEEILNFVEKTRPDLLVMNIHGKGKLDRVLLGPQPSAWSEGPCALFSRFRPGKRRAGGAQREASTAPG